MPNINQKLRFFNNSKHISRLARIRRAKHKTHYLCAPRRLKRMRAKRAGSPGFEPGRAVLETAMIPFHHEPIWQLYQFWSLWCSSYMTLAFFVYGVIKYQYLTALIKRFFV